MAPLKQKGDLAEMRVAYDLMAKGHKIAFPFGEDWDFDLVVQRKEDDRLERVQVKHATSDGKVIEVRCRSLVLTGGRVQHIKRYTAAEIDWLAVYDCTTDRCFYVPASALGTGRDQLNLRLVPPANRQVRGIRFAADHVDLTG